MSIFERSPIVLELENLYTEIDDLRDYDTIKLGAMDTMTDEGKQWAACIASQISIYDRVLRLLSNKIDLIKGMEKQ